MKLANSRAYFYENFRYISLRILTTILKRKQKPLADTNNTERLHSLGSPLVIKALSTMVLSLYFLTASIHTQGHNVVASVAKTVVTF